MSDQAAASDQAPVIIYSAPWCAFCKTEKQWMERLGVDFVEKDIEADPSARDELISKTGGQVQGVPVTDIAGDIVLGFDRPRLENALKTHNLITT